MAKIAEITVPAGGQATIDFTNIPQTYKHLVVTIEGTSMGVAVGILARVNADGGANYASSAGSDPTYAFIGTLDASGGYAGNEIAILNYAAPGKKTLIGREVWANNSASKGTTWSGNAAVTEVTFYANGGSFAAGTVAQLYGVDPQGGGGGGGAAPVLRLDYHPATDVATNAALAANTWTDFATEQTFTVGSALSLVEVSCGGNILIGGGAIGNASARLVIDAAGTPITRIISGTRTPSGEFNNVLSGASPLSLSGLAVGSHTVKLQIRADNALSVYCQASGPGYAFNLRVVEDAG